MITKKIRTAMAALAFVAASNMAPSTGSQTIDQIISPPSAAAYVNQKDDLFGHIQSEDSDIYEIRKDDWFLSDDRKTMKINQSGYKPNSKIPITDFIILSVDANKRIDTTPLMMKETGQPHQIRYLQFLVNAIALNKSQFNQGSGKYATVLEAVINYDRMDADGNEVGIQSLAPVMLYAGLNPHKGFFDIKYNQKPDGVNENIMMAYVSLQRKDEAKAKEFIAKLDKTNATEEDFVFTGSMLNKLGKKQLRVELYETAIKKYSESETLHKCLAIAYEDTDRMDLAKKEYDKLVGLSPNNEGYKRAQKVLSQ